MYFALGNINTIRLLSICNRALLNILLLFKKRISFNFVKARKQLRLGTISKSGRAFCRNCINLMFPMTVDIRLKLGVANGTGKSLDNINTK